MWSYEKRLQFPVKIACPDARAAKVIITQYGGPDGELGASLRYLSQRYAMPYPELSAILTDIGTEAAEVVPGRAEPLQIGQKILGMVHFFRQMPENYEKG